MDWLADRGMGSLLNRGGGLCLRTGLGGDTLRADQVLQKIGYEGALLLLHAGGFEKGKRLLSDNRARAVCPEWPGAGSA